MGSRRRHHLPDIESRSLDTGTSPAPALDLAIDAHGSVVEEGEVVTPLFELMYRCRLGGCWFRPERCRPSTSDGPRDARPVTTECRISHLVGGCALRYHGKTGMTAPEI